MGKEQRFNKMSLREIFDEVIINKENWSPQKEKAVEYICENFKKKFWFSVLSKLKSVF